MLIELVYAPDCPNVDEARRNLRRALLSCGMPPTWTEHLESAAPAHARGYGSPTVLVDGHDVTGASPMGTSCRVYATPEGALARAPDVATLVRSLTAARPG